MGVVFLFSFSVHKAEATTCTSGSACTGGSGTWVAPAGITSVTAEVWGGGGAGAGETANNDGGEAGGGGGAYSKTINITVVPANSYTIGIGVAGVASTGAGTAGGDTWFNAASFAACTLISTCSSAKGGGGGSLNTTHGTGGATTGIGTTKTSGGNGGDGGALGTGSGAGGGSGGSGGNGGVGGNGSAGPTGGIAGAAGSGGGAAGGAGRGTSGTGNAGSAPGGGGAGAYVGSNANQTGGAGTLGQVILWYTTVSNVSSTLANGSYKAGQVVPITVTFSQAVTVTGTPQIQLETGTTDELVNYSSGSGSTVLTFNYTVQAGDTSSDLDYLSTNALTLNGGTITNAGGGNAILALPTVGGASSIAGQKAIVIDTTAPAAPGTPDMTTATDSGFSSTDNITNDTTPDFTISCETAATITLYDNTTSVGTGICVAGAVTITSSALSEGAHATINAKQTDVAGNVSSASGNLSITIDTTAPTISSIAPTTSSSINSITSSSDVSYTLSEAVASGTIVMTRTSGTADGSSPHTCTLKGNALNSGVHAAIDLSDTTNSCTSAQSLVSGTVYTLAFNATDTAGNAATTVSSTSVTFDNTAPTLTSVAIASNNADTSKAKSGDTITLSFTSSETISTPAVTFKSGGVPVAGSITTSNPSGNNWTASYTVQAGDTDGVVTFTIDFSDTAGNAGTQVSATTNSSSVTVDKTGPTLTSRSISSNNPNSNQAKVGNIVTVSFASSEDIGAPTVIFKSGGVSVAGSITTSNPSGNNWTASYTTQSGDTEGLVTFTIDFSDTAGNAGAQVTTTTDASTVAFDKTAPFISQVTPVTTPTNDTTPDYTFQTFEAGTITYGGDCASITTSANGGANTITFNTLADGTYSNCTIVVTDAAGNPSNTLAVSAFTIDTTGPTLAEVTPVPSPTSDNTPDYTFSSTEAGIITYGGDCSSTTTSASSGNNIITFNTLTDGTHSNCTIVVTDAAGNPSNILSVSSFAVDTTAPVISEITPVSSPTSDNTPDYIFNTTETGTITYGGDCGSVTTSAISGNNTITFDTLGDGTHSNCIIVVTDSVGNPSNSLSVSAFTVDTTGPIIAEITPVATPTSDNTPNYVFSSIEAGAITYGGDCSSATTSAISGNNTITFNTLTDGVHSNCTIQVIDSLGNPSNTHNVSAFTVDTNGSLLTEVTQVVSPTSDSTPDYIFSSTEAGSITYGGDCSSVTSAVTSGNNTITFNTLADGAHSNCTIIVTDTAGNPSNILAVSAFVIDTTGPTLVEVTPVSSPTADNTPDYTFSSTETGTITYGGDCSSATTSATSGNNTITFNALADGIHTNCTIVVTDSVGNPSNALNVSAFTITTILPATKIVIIDPADSSVGTPTTVTVRVEKADNSIDTTYSQDVTLVTSGSATGGGLVDIVNGVGTLDINDTVAETVALSLSDTETTGLDVSSTQDVVFSSTPAVATKFIILNPTDDTAGNPITVTVQAEKADDSIDTNYQSDVTLITSGSATGGGLVDIVNGVGTIIINDSIAETVDLSLSDSQSTGLDVSSIQDAVFLSPPTPAVKFVIINPANGTIGISSAITVKAERNDNSTDTNYQSDVTLITSGSATGGGLVDIVNGVGTIIINDSIAETVDLSLSDSQSTGLDVSSTQDIIFSKAVKKTAGTPPPPPTLLKFTGVAYPEATLTVVTRDSSRQQETPIKRDIVKSRDGAFSMTLNELPIGANKAYGLVITDQDGRNTQTKFYNIDIKPNITIEKTVFATPTLGVANAIVKKGDNAILIGYATPGSSVEAEIDGVMSGRKSIADASGSYRIEMRTAQLSDGGHAARTRQTSGAGVSDFSLDSSFSVTELSVPNADLNGDGIINISDWSMFLSIWHGGNDAAKNSIDFNADEKVDLSDFSIFIQILREQ